MYQPRPRRKKRKILYEDDICFATAITSKWVEKTRRNGTTYREKIYEPLFPLPPRSGNSAAKEPKQSRSARKTHSTATTSSAPVEQPSSSSTSIITPTSTAPSASTAVTTSTTTTAMDPLSRAGTASRSADASSDSSSNHRLHPITPTIEPASQLSITNSQTPEAEDHAPSTSRSLTLCARNNAAKRKHASMTQPY